MSTHVSKEYTCTLKQYTRTLQSTPALFKVHTHLNEASVPEQQVSPFAARQYFSIRKFNVTFNVGNLGLAEFTELALKFETGESAGHFPESAKLKFMG